ncbi:hypothetical protein VCV18_001137 [Metarhizium anisopliae]
MLINDAQSKQHVIGPVGYEKDDWKLDAHERGVRQWWVPCRESEIVEPTPWKDWKQDGGWKERPDQAD